MPEVVLTDIGLGELGGDWWEVLVGGSILGYTAVAAFKFKQFLLNRKETYNLRSVPLLTLKRDEEFSFPYPPSSTGLNFIPTMVAKITRAVEINIIMMPRADS